MEHPAYGVLSQRLQSAGARVSVQERGEGAFCSRTARNSVITVRLSERDLDALDALIEAGVRSTRSDAAAWLVGMAIDANPELFKQVFKTVTEIRRLHGEAQGLVHKSTPGEHEPAATPE